MFCAGSALHAQIESSRTATRLRSFIRYTPCSEYKWQSVRRSPGSCLTREARRLPGLLPDRDDGGRTPRKQRVDAAPQSDETIEDPELSGAKRPLLEDPAGQEPARIRNAIEIQQFCYLESGLFHARAQLLPGIAKVVSQRFVESAIDPLIVRHQNNGATARLQHRIDVAQAQQIVFYVFEHVETNHGVHLLVIRNEMLRDLQIAVIDFDVGAVLKAVAQTSQMFRVDIGGNI